MEYTTLLLDMDGTFYLGANLLDGSLDFLEKLRETKATPETLNRATGVILVILGIVVLGFSMLS